MARCLLEINEDDPKTARRQFLGKVEEEKKEEPKPETLTLEAARALIQGGQLSRRGGKRREVPEDRITGLGTLIPLPADRVQTERFTVEQIETALILADGMISRAALLLQCSPDLIRGQVKKYPRLQKAQKELKDATVDMAEAQLMARMRYGADMEAIKFFLSCHGKERGYVPRGQADTGPRSIRITVNPAPAVNRRDIEGPATIIEVVSDTDISEHPALPAPEGTSP